MTTLQVALIEMEDEEPAPHDDTVTAGVPGSISADTFELSARDSTRSVDTAITIRKRRRK